MLCCNSTKGLDLHKGIYMSFMSKRLSILAILIGTNSVLAQQTYNSQHHQITNSEQSLVEKVIEGVFVGCIDFTVTYSVSQNIQTEKVDDAELIIKETVKGFGDDRTICYNSNGDWLQIYNNGELVDKVWYFSESNEEYTYFRSGVLKFSVNNTPEPEGVGKAKIKNIERTNEKKQVLGFDTVKIEVTRVSGNVVDYWVSTDLIMNPRSYTNNKLAHTDELYESLSGVPLLEEKTVSNFVTTIQEATSVREGEPSLELFKLPAVDLYHW